MPIWLVSANVMALVLLAVGVAYGLLLLESINRRLGVIDARLVAARERFDIEGIESGKLGFLVENVAGLLSLARGGRIPSLRADDWKPSTSDRKRAEKVFEERSEDDKHLNPYLGPE
jgi:hypothetical protein